MSTGPRAGLTYAAAFVAGGVLFFLCFAAIFNGSWVMLLGILLCYVPAGAFGVRLGHAAPGSLSLVLVAPAVPWVLWLFPASLAETGLWRALLWPGLVLLMGGLGWLGATGARATPARRASGRPGRPL